MKGDERQLELQTDDWLSDMAKLAWLNSLTDSGRKLEDLQG